ncbi:interferon alpha/beta receptor 2-like [Polypterus senegalus]|uniref:interferon alpha/beta receptor 2-like n=1 Tax=Polypterus senegalus TaxID=55291 RepID=UPI0019646849|nr:interferon alpha/beta receptor 2-like [Polypterus senegalus]
MKSLFAVLVHSMTFITVARGSLPAPANVYFDSHNFEHVLRWHPGTGTPAGTQYRVQYRREGNNWSLVGDCLNVTYVPECNLTGRLENMEYYKARVQAFNETHQSNWKHSVAFQPVSETILGPPSVTLSGCGNCLLLNMSSPRGSGVNSLQDTYYNIDYNVHLRKSGEEKC